MYFSSNKTSDECNFLKGHFPSQDKYLNSVSLLRFATASNESCQLSVLGYCIYTSSFALDSLSGFANNNC